MLFCRVVIVSVPAAAAAAVIKLKLLKVGKKLTDTDVYVGDEYLQLDDF